MIAFTIDNLRLVNISNARWHWAQRARMAADHRLFGRVRMGTAIGGLAVRFPIEVAIVRIGPGRMDSDNLAISAKSLRDGIADALGIDDGDEARVTWRYSQEKPAKGAPRYGVRVEVREQVAVAS